MPISRQSLFDFTVIGFTKVKLSHFWVRVGKSSSIEIRAVSQIQSSLVALLPSHMYRIIQNTRATFHLLGSALQLHNSPFLCSRPSALHFILLVTCTLPRMQPSEMCLKELRQSWSVQFEMASATKGPRVSGKNSRWRYYDASHHLI